MNKGDGNSRERTLSALTVVLAMMSLAICLVDWFKVSGSKYGMFYGVFVDPEQSRFAAEGPNYYQSINTWYFVISICFSVYLIGKLLGSSRSAVAARIFTFCVAVFPFVNMLSYKYGVMTVRPGYEWLETSIYLDSICLVSIATVMCLEIISLISSTRTSNNVQLEL